MFKLCAHALVVLLACARLDAQTALQRREPIPQYVLGPGDQIYLHVADMEELPDKPMTINPSGMIDLPLVGPVQAAGLSLPELKSSLSVLLSLYITKPDISINLMASGSQPSQ